MMKPVWTEKYRPSTMEGLLSHEDIIKTVNNFLKQNEIPHLLFYGPPGTGKTSLALIIAHHLYSEKCYRQFVLELNASDSRGIETIRNEIKHFVTVKEFFPASSPAKQFKLVILDEADQITPQAQNALRRLIEQHVANARFFLLCNYSSKIIPALQSRCSRFRFRPVSAKKIREKLSEIIREEDLEVTEDGLTELVEQGQGDLRNSINILQSVSYSGVPISAEVVCSIIGRPTPQQLQGMFEILLSKTILLCYSHLGHVVEQCSLSVEEILHSLAKKVKETSLLTPLQKGELCIRFAEIEYSLSLGCSEQVQLLALVAAFLSIKYN